MNKIICIGGSTGAPAALTEILKGLPEGMDCPMLVALHMPPAMSRCYALALEGKSTYTVAMAQNGARPEPATVYLSEGGKHIGLSRDGRIVTSTRPENTTFKPSIDVLFHTAAQALRSKVVAVVLCGLSARRDAVDGATTVKNAGGQVLVLDDPANRFLGMPKLVIDAGAATDTGTLDLLPNKLAQAVA